MAEASFNSGYSSSDEGDQLQANDAATAPSAEDLDRSNLPKKIMKTTSLHLQFFCVVIMKVGCNIRELSNKEINATQRAIKMFRNVEQGLRDRIAFPLPDGVAASQVLKHSYFNLANGGETEYVKFCVGTVPAKELTKAMIHHGESLYTNKFLETRCKIRLTAQPKFKDILKGLQPNARSGLSADDSQYLQKANEQLHVFLFHQHSVEPTIDSVTKQPKHYKEQEYNPSWQQIWWLFWCTECSPSGKRSASATMEALEESSGPSLEPGCVSSPAESGPRNDPKFPTSDAQKQSQKYMSRRAIDNHNKEQRSSQMEGVCEHSWLPHPVSLNGLPAVFCRKCTLMKACIVQDTSATFGGDLPLTPSNSSLRSSTGDLTTPLTTPNDSESLDARSTSVSKQLFAEKSNGVQQNNLFDEYHQALASLEKTVWNVNIERKARVGLVISYATLCRANSILQDSGTFRGRGIFAKTFIPKNQVVALYRGAPNTLLPLFRDAVLIIVHAGDIVNGVTGEVVQTNPFTDYLRSIYPQQFETVTFSRQHACCLLGQPALFCIDGSYHRYGFDDRHNRGGFPWGALLNSSERFVFLFNVLL
jgi:hypothetical protein